MAAMGPTYRIARDRMVEVLDETVEKYKEMGIENWQEQVRWEPPAEILKLYESADPIEAYIDEEVRKLLKDIPDLFHDTDTGKPRLKTRALELCSAD